MRETVEEYLERYHKRLKEKEEELAFVLIQQFSDRKVDIENIKTETWKSAKKLAEKEYDEVRNAKVEMFFFYENMGKKKTTTASKVEELAETETINGYKPTAIAINTFPVEG